MVIDSSPLPDDGVASLAEQFQRDGYVMARGVFSPEEVAEIRELWNIMVRFCFSLSS